jgi:hypothetical protein
MQESLHVGIVPIPGCETVNGERMSKVVNSRLLMCVSSTDARVIAQSSELRFESPVPNGAASLCREEGGVGWPSLRPSAVILNQDPVQLRSHGNQSRLAELRVPNRQHGPTQIHVGASEVCRLADAQASPIVQQNHCADRHRLHCAGALRIGLDYPEKAADFFLRVDVGNEDRRTLRHYGRKRERSDVSSACGISEEAPQAAQSGEPRLGHWPGFAKERIHMPNANIGNAGSRAACMAKSPENYCIRDEG